MTVLSGRYVALTEAALLFTLFSAGQAQPIRKTSVSARRARQTDDCREVLFRKLIRGSQREAVVFISVDGRDPPPVFLNRLRRYRHDLQPRSVAQPLDREHPSPWELKTGRDGVVLKVDEVRWIGSHTVELKAGYWGGVLDASTTTYRLKLSHGQWRIVRTLGSIVS